MTGNQRRNIVFVLTDQERYLHEYPAGLEVPGRRWLTDNGVRFTNHYTASTMCTSSRSVIYTGQHMQNTGMYDNANFDFVGSLSPKIPTVGTMLREAGYYTAYKGKWHLSSELDPDPDRDHDYSHDMERYGFSDWNPTGDVIGNPWDGFIRDNGTVFAAIEWLRAKGLQLRAAQTPWFLSVDLVNPHDIMYFNTDLPGEAMQDPGGLLFPTTRAPDTPSYSQSYSDVVPESFGQEIDEHGRPAVHQEFENAMALALGKIPPTADRWQRFNDYYFNCIQEVDRKIDRLIGELDDLGFLDDTIIVFTSDHGEMGGAHGMRGKGGNGYEESIHVPLVVATPDGPSGVTCDAVTSHLDLAPTLLSLGSGNGTGNGSAVSALPGHDLTPLVREPAGDAAAGGVRDAALFSCSGVLTLDADFLGQVGEVLAGGGDPAELKKTGVRPDLTKRGFQRTIVSGRYKYSRYFAPTQHHIPDGVEQARELNDLELFDLAEDPYELTNLATQGADRDDLVAELNHKMSTLIREEVGAAEDGRYLPALPEMDWAVTEFNNV